MSPLVVARDGGQLEATSNVDNYPGFDEGVDAIELIQRLGNQVRYFLVLHILVGSKSIIFQ